MVVAIDSAVSEQNGELGFELRRNVGVALARRIVAADGSANRALRMLTADPSICHFEALEIIKARMQKDRRGPIWKQV